MKTLYAPCLLLTAALLLSSCTPGTTVVTGNGKVTSGNDKSVTLRVDGRPNAQITAAGDLEIGGQAVAVTAAQRVLLQTYQREMAAMTTDGIAIGKQGAALAGKAVSAAIAGAISGDGDKVGDKVEGEARKIEQQAMQLCKRLVTIKAAQDQLATQLPAFAPYATIDMSDVDNCGSSDKGSFAAGKDVGGSVAKAMKEEDQGADATGSEDAAARADAAADQASKH